MAQIFETLIKFFQEDEWKISQLENKKILQMGFSGNNGNWTCYAQAIDEDGQFIFYSVCPVKVPPDKKISVAELITRANYGLLIGNFELDFNDGEIRYKTSIDIQDQSLTSSLIRQLVYANVVMMDRYMPAIMAVIYGNFSPQQAIAEIENNLETASKES
jgi:hypothetical protein